MSLGNKLTLRIPFVDSDGALSSTSFSVQCSSRPHSSLLTHSLSEEAHFYLQFWHTAVLFLLLRTGLTPTFPIKKDILIIFFGMHGSFSSTQYYIKFFVSHKALPFQSWLQLNLSAFLRLQLILRGIKRSQGDNSKPRRPITLNVLYLFYHLLIVRYTSNKDSLMVWAAMKLAFFFVLWN